MIKNFSQHLGQNQMAQKNYGTYSTQISELRPLACSIVAVRVSMTLITSLELWSLSMTMYLWAKNFSHFLLLKKIMLIYMAIGHYKGHYVLHILQHASNFWKKILYLPSSISSSKPCLKIVTNIHTYSKK